MMPRHFVRLSDYWNTPDRNQSEPVHRRVVSLAACGEVPWQTNGWSWAAFLWGPFWALYHRVWWGLFTFVPFIGLLVLFGLGAAGKQQAWRNGSWSSVDEMESEERTWVVVWICIAVVLVCILLLLLVK